MKKIYVLTLCCAVAMSASAGGHRFKTVRGHKDHGRIIAKESAATLWRPVSQTDYMHDGESWMKMGSVSFEYDDRGNRTGELLDEDGFLSKTATTYDEYDYPLTVVQTESEDGENWDNSGMTTYTYDPRVHGFFTERIGYDWTGSDWTRNYRCEANAITRNADGNIVELVKSLPLGSELQPAFKSAWSYGADGKAEAYGYYVTENGTDWQLYDDISYKDLDWEITDGQMTVLGDLLELTEGANLLRSAVVYYQGEPDGHYIVEYFDGMQGFLIRETTNDINEVGRTVLMETLDANGSIRLTTTEYFDEDGNILGEPAYVNVQEALMDDHGNLMEYSERETVDGIEELIASTRYLYTYDSTGNPSEVTTEEYDYDSQEYFPMERTVYGEYIDVTAGVSDAATDDSATWKMEGDLVTATASGLTGLSVFNLQGVCVRRAAADDYTATVSLAGLMPGAYIVGADGMGSTRKIVKR